MPLFQGCPYFRGVLISGVSIFQGYKGAFISGVPLFQGCPYFKGALISRVPLFQGCPYFKGALAYKRSSVFPLTCWANSLATVIWTLALPGLTLIADRAILQGVCHSALRVNVLREWRRRRERRRRELTLF